MTKTNKKSATVSPSSATVSPSPGKLAEPTSPAGIETSPGKSAETPSIFRPSGFKLSTYKPKLKVGFYGTFDASDSMVQVNKGFVGTGSLLGFANDQHHPHSIYIISNEPKNSLRACYALGCDILVEVTKSDNKLDPNLSVTFRGGFKFCKGKASELYYTLHQLSSVFGRESFLEDPMQFYSSEDRDGERLRCFNDALGKVKRHCKKPIFTEAIIILGGAGPHASMKMMEKILREQPRAAVIHNSYNPTPGKQDSLDYYDQLPEGNFVQYYSHAIKRMELLMERGTLVAPCNTAHAVFDKWARSDKITFIDYRKEVIDHCLELGINRLVILGTSTTTHKNRIYQTFAERNSKPIQFMVSDQKGSEIIDKAIYLIKQGFQEEAKGMIVHEIVKLRELHGGNIVIGLFCTELPTVFSSQELKARKLLCASEISVKPSLLRQGGHAPSKPKTDVAMASYSPGSCKPVVDFRM